MKNTTVVCLSSLEALSLQRALSCCANPHFLGCFHIITPVWAYIIVEINNPGYPDSCFDNIPGTFLPV